MKLAIVGKVERYHGPLRRAFEIMYADIGTVAAPESILQMAVKAVKDTAGPNGLLPTLLVFGAYPRMTLDSPKGRSRAESDEGFASALRRETSPGRPSRPVKGSGNVSSWALRMESVCIREKLEQAVRNDNHAKSQEALALLIRLMIEDGPLSQIKHHTTAKSAWEAARQHRSNSSSNSQ